MQIVEQKVTVLLAVFNGRLYLEEQLTSLVEQEGVHVIIHANDDGSDDGSFELLQEWKEKGSIAKLTQTDRIGATHSFFKLLRDVENTNWVALCDQDDVWNKDKLFLQIESLESSGNLMATCARLYIDEQGLVFGQTNRLRIPPSFQNALMENVAPGNTIVLHPKAVKLVNQFQHPEIVHYDSWIYLLISGIDNCIYLPTPLVKYRIHDSNLVGKRKFGLRKICVSLEQYILNARILEEIAFEKLLPHNQLKLREFNSATRINSIKSFIMDLKGARFRRQSRLDQTVIVLTLRLLKLARRIPKR